MLGLCVVRVCTQLFIKCVVRVYTCNTRAESTSQKGVFAQRESQKPRELRISPTEKGKETNFTCRYRFIGIFSVTNYAFRLNEAALSSHGQLTQLAWQTYKCANAKRVEALDILLYVNSLFIYNSSILYCHIQQSTLHSSMLLALLLDFKEISRKNIVAPSHSEVKKIQFIQSHYIHSTAFFNSILFIYFISFSF